VIVYSQPQKTQNEVDVISNTTDERESYQTLTTDTQQPPADDDAGNVYDVIPDEPETYEALRDGVGNTGTNNIHEQQPAYSLIDDEGNAPKVPPPRGNIASNNNQERPTDHSIPTGK